MLGAVLLALLLYAPGASAKITAVPYGGTTDVNVGGHGDLTTGTTFDYGSDTTSTVQKILIDTPAGGVGNPNAIPWADRCTTETFQNSTCDPKSQIGVVTISVIAYVGALPIPMNDMTGTISQLQTDPEVPTRVGAYIAPPIGDPIRAFASFYPVTNGPDGDFRIRTETDDFPTTAHVGTTELPVQITKYEQKLFATTTGGNVFITNPTRCDTWYAWGYAKFYGDNSGANYDPFGTGTNDYERTEAVPTQPNCGALAPFTATADAHIDSPRRGEALGYSTTLTMPGLEAVPQSAAVPKTVQATLPKGVTIDVQQLGRVCSNEDFAARRCPASTQVGNARITTPMIAAGLTGEAYMVKASPGHNLPDLGIHVHGAIDFLLRGTTRFVNVNEIQSTFDNIPQVGFATFTLNVFGGKNGLLMLRECPLDGRAPKDGGATHFALTSYQGQIRNFYTPTVWASPPCVSYKISLKNYRKCLRKSLRVAPKFRSRKQVRFVRVYVRGKYVKKAKHSPYRAHVTINKRLRKGRTYKYKVKAWFKPDRIHRNGHVATKTAKFRPCR